MSGAWALISASVVIGVLVGWWIGRMKGYALLGAIIGLAGIIGWIIIALIPRRTPPVPSAALHEPGTPHRPADLPADALPHHPDGTPHHERPNGS